MLLRKRAWDVMRTDFLTIEESAGLTEAIAALHKSLETSQDNDCVVVTSDKGRFLGVLTVRSALMALGPCLLKELHARGDQDWERSFDHAVRACSRGRVSEYVQKGVPVVKPAESLGRVLEMLNDYRTNRLAVEEGDKIIGLILHADVFKELCRETEIC